MRYFVSFCYEKEGRIEFGHTSVKMNKEVAEYGDIVEMERRLSKAIGIEHPIVMNYKPLNGAGFEYVRCGDAETIRASGNGMIFTPNINIKIKSSGDIGKIEEALKKLLISKIQG